MAALRRDFDGRPTMVIAGAIGVLGAIGFAIAVAFAPERALAAYLAVWCTAMTIAVGGLAVLVIGYAASGHWFAVVRRLSEAAALAIAPLAVLSLPLVLGAAWVWPWVDEPPRNGYFALPFAAARSALYLAIFIVPAEVLRRWSRRRDSQPTETLDRERTFASAMLPAIGLAITFAGFDWLMSLQPEWWSSGFGLYVLTGTLVAGLAMVTVLAWRGVAARAMPVAPPHFHALGRLLHAFVILWAYIAYFQAMLIQIANKPLEATFYVARSSDGWRFVTALLVVLAFALPFPLLVPRRLKRRAGYLAGIAVMLLVARYIDMWWLVLPTVSATPVPAWSDLAALAAVGGLTIAVCAWRMHGTPLLPIGDPYLADGLTYETNT